MSTTPGPWTFETVDYGGDPLRPTITRTGMHFSLNAQEDENGGCECVMCSAPSGTQGGAHGPSDADARLIAAAPDLYEACKALQAEAKARNCGLRIADEAIAKAEAL